MAIANKELKRLRLARELTQKQLAESLGISSARYSAWERGEKQPSTEFVQKLSELLDCSTSKLLSVESDEFSNESFNDKHSSFSYFVDERKDEEGISRWREELIIKIKPYEKPLNFILSDASRKKSLSAIIRGSHDFIWVETYNDKMFYINTDCIEWTILHDEASDEYPDLSGDEFHETPIQKADVTKEAILYMMARNGSFDAGNPDCHYPLLTDFEWLTRHKSRLIDDIPKVISSYKERLGDNYNNFLHDSENTGYDEDFLNSWGIRIILKNGKEIFLPGMMLREEAWDEALIEIRNMNLYDDNHVTTFSDDERCNRYIFPTKDIALIEYPRIFEAMGLYAQYEGLEEISEEEIDSKIEELYELALDADPVEAT